MTEGPEQLEEEKSIIDDADIPYTQRVFTFIQSLEDKDEIEPVFTSMIIQCQEKYDRLSTNSCRMICRNKTISERCMEVVGMLS